jgi:hypothetical protein
MRLCSNDKFVKTLKILIVSMLVQEGTILLFKILSLVSAPNFIRIEKCFRKNIRILIM